MLHELKAQIPYGRIAAALVEKHPGLFQNRDEALATIVRTVPALSTVAGDF
jgi:hypothetical protein